MTQDTGGIIGPLKNVLTLDTSNMDVKELADLASKCAMVEAISRLVKGDDLLLSLSWDSDKPHGVVHKDIVYKSELGRGGWASLAYCREDVIFNLLHFHEDDVAEYLENVDDGFTPGHSNYRITEKGRNLLQNWLKQDMSKFLTSEGAKE